MTRLARAVLAAAVVAALLAPWIAPFDPSVQLDVLSLKNRPPSWQHWLGTDPYSRDMLSRLLFGARTTMLVSATATIVATAIGLIAAALAQWMGRQAGALVLTVADVARSVPRLLVLLCAAAVAGTMSPGVLAVIIGASASPMVCRLMYATLIDLERRPYVEAAHALGVSRVRVVWRHLLPHALAPLMAMLVLLFGDVMALEASLSFLGLGVRAPGVSWGSMMQDAQPFLDSAWWVAAIPGTCLVVTIVCCAHLADRSSRSRREQLHA